MFHDKHRTTRHGTTHRDDGLTAAARPAVSGDDALEDLLRTLRDERGFAFATLQNHRRSLRPFLAWLADARVPGLKPRSATCPRTWRVGRAGVARRSRFMCSACVRSFDMVPRVVGVGQGSLRRSRLRGCTRTSGCPKVPNGARSKGS